MSSFLGKCSNQYINSQRGKLYAFHASFSLYGQLYLEYSAFFLCLKEVFEV